MDESVKFMEIALLKARNGLAEGNLPVGAALVINGELADSAYNANKKNGDWNSHAETIVLGRNAGEIYSVKRRDRNSSVELFTTWEPCLMCLGTSVLNRVDRISYACPDPRGGAAALRPEHVGPGYSKLWPELVWEEEFQEQSYTLLLSYMEEHRERWETMIGWMKQMRRR